MRLHTSLQAAVGARSTRALSSAFRRERIGMRVRGAQERAADGSQRDEEASPDARHVEVCHLDQAGHAVDARRLGVLQLVVAHGAQSAHEGHHRLRAREAPPERACLRRAHVDR